MTVTTSTSDYLENAILNLVFRGVDFTTSGSVWVGLYLNDPKDANSGSEVASSGDYARSKVPSFYEPSNRGTANSASIVFNTSSGSWGTVTYVGILSASSSGSLLFYGPLSAPRTIGPGDNLAIPTGNLYLNLSGAYSETLGNYMLKYILNGSNYPYSGSSLYAALYITTPDYHNSGGSEVAAGDYTRQYVSGSDTWDIPASGSTSNSSTITFVTSSSGLWGTITGVGLLSASIAGDLLFSGNLVTPITIVGGDGFRFPAGGFKVAVT